jgi:exodeoxyribonuclease V gamma subunit
MPVRLFTSNRLEILAESLAQRFQPPLPSPMEPEVIIVQSRGMEHWVSMELAKRQGVCANCRFPFPNAFIHEIFRRILPGQVPECSHFDPKILTWTVMKRLPACISRPGFESIRSYLGDSKGDLKAYQLSRRIADTFDQYLVFRPEMILRWEKGEEDHWQAVLWRELTEENKCAHRAGLGKAFIDTISTSNLAPAGLPERIAVFGISALPRFHMELLAGLSRLTEVNLFLLNPCREYWGDIASDWEMRKAAIHEGVNDLSPGSLYMRKGNSLLASMGTMGRDFFDLINEFASEDHEMFEEPGEDCLLSCIQSDMLHLRERPLNPDGKSLVARDDFSIQIHACHSPMREMEVLHDRLLDLFERDPRLTPGDVLVMTPEVETYAPYIQAVFDMPAGESGRIPFTIADRNVRQESEMLKTFLGILELGNERFQISKVLEILESSAVRCRFNISEDDLDLIRNWIRETRIRWGIDEKNRQEMGLPSLPDHTWKAGLQRLLLGYAMPRHQEMLFKGLLPYDHMEGTEVALLGNLVHFCESLFMQVLSLNELRTLKAWSVYLTGLLETFFLPDETNEKEIHLMRLSLGELVEIQAASCFEEKVDLSTIRWHLAHELERKGFGFGFMTGGVTFCAMLPMRSIPFKVICLVGMNGNAYPRDTRKVGFDLIARHPRPGDRLRRSDDRYLFLETLLSAREILYISYVGQSVQDNSAIPPSVLVSELMDYIEQGFEHPDKEILEHVVTLHRLQAFSPEYFKGEGNLFSYSDENCRAARLSLAQREDPPPFISKGLSEPDETWRTVSLDELCRFFGQPAKALLMKRLGMQLEETEVLLEESEPFDIIGLERYTLGEDLLKRALAGFGLQDAFPRARASGQLPHGTVGRCLFEQMALGVQGFAEKVTFHMHGPELEPLEVDFQVQDFRVTGIIHSIYPEKRVQYRYAQVTGKDRLRMWVQHLVMNCVGRDTYPCLSMLAGLSTARQQESGWTAWEYGPVGRSEELLVKMLEAYWSGLKRPLHFFPESSWIYVQNLILKNRSAEEALQTARSVWTGDEFRRGESQDPYYRLCFKTVDPIDSAFMTLSEVIFGPFLAHQREA